MALSAVSAVAVDHICFDCLPEGCSAQDLSVVLVACRWPVESLDCKIESGPASELLGSMACHGAYLPGS